MGPMAPLWLIFHRDFMQEGPNKSGKHICGNKKYLLPPFMTKEGSHLIKIPMRRSKTFIAEEDDV
jgi:hypothetical protein